MPLDELIKRFADLLSGSMLKWPEFKDVKNKRSPRRDLHALLLLDSLDPGDDAAITGAEHDEVFLGFSVETVAKKIVDEQIIELVACGVCIEDECFRKFV